MNYLNIISAIQCAILAVCPAFAETHVLSETNVSAEIGRGDAHEHPTLIELGADYQKYKAPLYWSCYELCIDQLDEDFFSRDIPREKWAEIMDWVATELKPYGYDMICTDGFIEAHRGGFDFKSCYGSMYYKELAEMAHARGLKLGIYDIPMDYPNPDDDYVPGTQYKFSSLRYNPAIDEVYHPDAIDETFRWIVMSHPGSKEYVRGLLRHFKEVGADFVRLDYLSYYEDGIDRKRDSFVGKGYGRQNYADLLAVVADEAESLGLMVSLVMPHLYNDAEVESHYGHMYRIVRDTWDGGWKHTSTHDRGLAFDSWPNCNNQFDGFTYWSHKSGRDKAILDGDFTRLSTFDTDAEKRFCISIQRMAGGPIAIADHPGSIGDNLKFYTNDEMLALNHDRFVGKPLSDIINSEDSNIWYGQMSDGDWVVGFFNREDNPKTFNLDFSRLGINGPRTIRDLWAHADEGYASSIRATVEPHGCKIVRLSEMPIEADNLYMVGDPTQWNFYELIKTAEHKFYYEGPVTGGSDVNNGPGRFRVAATPSWSTPIHAVSNGTIVHADGTTAYDIEFDNMPSGDKNWIIRESGTYRILFDLGSRTMTATTDLSKSLPVISPTLYIVGDASPDNWNIEEPTRLTSDVANPYIFTYQGYLNTGEFKGYLRAGNWDSNVLHPVENISFGEHNLTESAVGIYRGGKDYKWHVTTSGYYRLTFNLQEMTLSTEYFGESPKIEPIETENLYLIGDYPINWNFSTKLVKSDDETFVYSGSLTAGTRFRASTFPFWGRHIRPKTSNAPIDMTPSKIVDFMWADMPDYNWLITEDGYYNLAFNTKTWTLSINRQDISNIESVNTDCNNPPEYYTLQGIRVEKPQRGELYIKRQNGEAGLVLEK